MAKKVTARVEIRAEDKASATVGKVQTRFQKFSSFMKVGFVAALGSAAVAIRKIAQVMEEATQAAAVQEKAYKGLEDQLFKLGPKAAGVTEALAKQASALQKVTTFGDEVTLQAQQQLAVFTQNEDQLKALTVVTQDFATAQGISLVNAAQLLAKTFGSSTNALSRYGIEVEGVAGSTERLESLVENVTELFGGRAKAAVETYAGAMKQLENAQGDTLEAMGEMITKNKDVIKSIKERTAVAGLLTKALSEQQKTTGGLALAGAKLALLWDKQKAGMTLFADSVLALEFDFRRFRGEVVQVKDALTLMADAAANARDKTAALAEEQRKAGIAKELTDAINEAAQAYIDNAEAIEHNEESIRLLNEAEEEARRLKEQGLTPAVDRLAAAEDSLVTSTDDATQATRDQIRAQQDLQRELDRTEQQTERTILTNERAARAQRAASGRETFAEINARGESIVPGGTISERRTVYSRLGQ